MLNIRNPQEQSMVHIDDLRVCKSCGNVFSKKAGVTNILECPQCKGTSLEPIKTGYDELTQE